MNESNNNHETANGTKPVHLEDEPYCHNCGEDKNLRYNEQYANGEYWTCKECGENFFYNRKEHCH